MKRFVIPFLIGFIIICAAITQAESEVSVRSMPPVVIKTIPQAGDTSVDPFIKEIRVTFSKEMMIDNMWSWVMISKESFPKITGQVKYLNDKRTCIAPVKLEPGKAYVVWFNSERYNAFRDTDNNPAVPYLLVFETRK